MYDITFMMEVDLYADDLHLKVETYKDLITEWYTNLAYDKKDFKIEHVMKNIFKVNYESDYEEDKAEMQIVADPDDDGNYPININNFPYLVFGKIISASI